MLKDEFERKKEMVRLAECFLITKGGFQMKVPYINYQEEIEKCKSMDDVVGKNGLMQRLLKDVI